MVKEQITMHLPYIYNRKKPKHSQFLNLNFEKGAGKIMANSSLHCL